MSATRLGTALAARWASGLDREETKLIFLDVDEVLTTHESKFAAQTFTEEGDLCHTAVRLLNRVCIATDAKVVICSTWRHPGRSPQWWMALLSQFGGTAIPVIGETPHLRTGFRGDEIDAYLAGCDFQVGAYLVLDDGVDFHAHQPHVRPVRFYGVQLRHALEMLKILAPDCTLYQQWGRMLAPNEPDGLADIRPD